jgi:hypothetical protein
VTELVRRILGDRLAGRRELESFEKEAVLAFVALGRGTGNAVSERHDEALDEALRAGFFETRGMAGDLVTSDYGLTRRMRLRDPANVPSDCRVFVTLSLVFRGPYPEKR